MNKTEQGYYVELGFKVFATSDEEAIRLAQEQCNRIEEDHAIVLAVNKPKGWRKSMIKENVLA